MTQFLQSRNLAYNAARCTKSFFLAMLAILLVGCSGGGDDGDAEEVCLYFYGCTKVPIRAWAGADQSVVDGDTVVLEGITYASSGLSYNWRQLSGPPVSISGSALRTARFEAPSVSSTTALVFRLTVRNSSETDTADVTVVVAPTSATALCLQAPLFATSYAWTSSGCTTDSADIVGDSRAATLYRQSEAEPNDLLQTANSLVFPSEIATEPPAADVEGSVHSAGGDGSDYYVFTPPSSGDYRIYLCNDPVACTRGTVSEDWFLMLYDQNFNIVARTWPGTLIEQKVMSPLDAGLPYYVGVSSQIDRLEYWQYNLTIMRD